MVLGQAAAAHPHSHPGPEPRLFVPFAQVVCAVGAAPGAPEAARRVEDEGVAALVRAATLAGGVRQFILISALGAGGQQGLAGAELGGTQSTGSVSRCRALAVPAAVCADSCGSEPGVRRRFWGQWGAVGGEGAYGAPLFGSLGFIVGWVCVGCTPAAAPCTASHFPTPTPPAAPRAQACSTP